jgi:hypothetical protein
MGSDLPRHLGLMDSLLRHARRPQAPVLRSRKVSPHSCWISRVRTIPKKPGMSLYDATPNITSLSHAFRFPSGEEDIFSFRSPQVRGLHSQRRRTDYNSSHKHRIGFCRVSPQVSSPDRLLCEAPPEIQRRLLRSTTSLLTSPRDSSNCFPSAVQLKSKIRPAVNFVTWCGGPPERG